MINIDSLLKVDNPEYWQFNEHHRYGQFQMIALGQIPAKINEEERMFLESINSDKETYVEAFGKESVNRICLLGTCGEDKMIYTRNGETKKESFKKIGDYTLERHEWFAKIFLNERLQKEKEYEKILTHISVNNYTNLRKELDKINIYQLSIGDAENKLKTTLEIIETGSQQKFLKAQNDSNLLLKAYILGADAIVEYQPGSAMGTPVKFVEKNESR
jgi:hypothetical protein